MIYSDREIEKAIYDGRLLIDPSPGHDQFDSTSLNLRVGDDFLTWKRALGARGTAHIIDLDYIDLPEIIDFTDRVLPTSDGSIVIPPGAFVLVRTLEHVTLPIKSKIAARVEGRSKQARLGLTAHITAPIIHAGFSGKITLEVVNHGPFELRVRPGRSKLCQLIFEEVKGVPRRGGSAAFSQQATPLGTPSRNR